MLKLGLTGGLGSGKSTVASIFELLEVPVYYADGEAKHLMETDESIRQAIRELFGADSYVDNRLNRAFISSSVFGNPEKLSRLNAIVHPATLAHSALWMQEKESEGCRYAIKEAALIFESEAWQQLDYVIGVSSPLMLRVSRAAERDGITEDEVMKRINNQMDEEEKMKRCDFVLVNNERELLIPQVIALHHRISGLPDKNR